MKHFLWKALLPHVIAVAIFIIIAVLFCKPVLDGKVLSQGDVIHWKGMAQDMVNYQQTHGHFPLWTNNLFGGMPGYQIIAPGGDNPVFSISFLHNKLFMLGLPKPIGYFFLLCIGFYFLSQVIGVSPWLGIMGGIAYAYATYSPVIVSVGHDTKMQAMGYLPALLGALWLIYHKKFWWGAALTALFSCMFIAMNHLQVVYYFILMAGIMTLAFIIHWIKQKEYKHLALSLAIALIAGSIGAATNLVNLATTSDYAKATMRGGSLRLDSAATKNVKSDGLSIDYAFLYGSVGLSESFAFLVPDVNGGCSPGELDGSSHIAKAAVEKGIPEDQATQLAASLTTYWGPQPLNAGPVYLGSIICFLFILGIVYLKTWHRWWILAVCVLAVMMSWGSNFSSFNTFLFNHLPLYNKFRAPSIILVLPQLLFPLLAVMALQQFLFDETNKTEAFKKLKTAALSVGAFVLVAVLLYLSYNYIGRNDDQLKGELSRMLGNNQEAVNSFYNALKEDRRSLFGADLLRSILLIAAAIGLLWLVVKNKIKAIYALAGILLLSSYDLLAVGRRYLNDNNYQEEETINDNYFKPTPVDLEILKDSTHPRVLNLVQSDPFTDAVTPYHHRSIGGYHPAKLSIYDDLITHQIRKQPMNMAVLDMLNTKYFIVPNQQNGQPMLQVNPSALGQAWFVKHISFQHSPAAAMRALDHFSPKDTAVVEEAFKKDIPFEPVADSTASIRLIKNDNDEIRYQSGSKTNQFAVFSEIYYNRGWKAYIDGRESPIIQTDYALRGLAVPAGNHEILFEFKPASYYTSIKAAIGASVFIWLLLIGAVVNMFRTNRKESA
ncbi:MAG: YfhO family protein [Sediminibacterium sp.]